MIRSRSTTGITMGYRAEEERVPPDHPLRALKGIVAATLDELEPQLRESFSAGDWPAVPPEKILRLQLLETLYSVPSEHLMLEQLEYNLLFRWFVGLTLDDAPWDRAAFTRARDMLAGTDVAREFFARVRERARGSGILGDEHFAPGAAIIEEWSRGTTG